MSPALNSVSPKWQRQVILNDDVLAVSRTDGPLGLLGISPAAAAIDCQADEIDFFVNVATLVEFERYRTFVFVEHARRS